MDTLSSALRWEQLSAFQQHRMDDLRVLYKLLTEAYTSGHLPALADVPSNVLLTAAGTVLLAQLLMLLLSRSGRTAVFQTIDTIVAIILIIVLIGIVLGLPIGAAYLLFRGTLFVGSALLGAFPQLQQLVNSLPATDGLEQ